VQARDAELAPLPVAPERRRSNIKSTVLLSVGLGLFVGGYLGSVLNYSLNTSIYEPTLVIPVAGPWVTMATADWNELHDTDRPLGKATLALNGIMQLAGIAVLVAGIVVRRQAAHAAASARFHFAGGATRHGAQGSLRYAF
jgi:hypothetical protein